MAAPNLVQIRRWGLLDKWVKYNDNFFYLFIYTYFSSTHLQVRRDDGFSRLMVQTTRTRARMCLVGVSLTLLPILAVKSPENPNFLGREYAFSSQTGKILKVSCYRNYSIDFNQLLHNDRDHQVVVVGGPNRRPTNPRWRTTAILKKTVKSLYLCNRLTDFDKFSYSDARWLLTADRR